MQQNRTTVEKLEKNFKKSSERKKERESEEEPANMVFTYWNVCKSGGGGYAERARGVGRVLVAGVTIRG